MFDLGWTEMLLIGIVALIVVGPKDLPGMFRTVGQFIGKAKGMAREFSKAMNDAADESGMKDMADTLKKATNPVGSAMAEVRKSTDSFTKSTMNSGLPKDKTPAKPPAAAADTTEKAETAAPAEQAPPKEPAQPDAKTAKAKPAAPKKPATPKKAAAPKKTAAAPKTAAAKKTAATPAKKTAPARKPAQKAAPRKTAAVKASEDKA